MVPIITFRASLYSQSTTKQLVISWIIKRQRISRSENAFCLTARSWIMHILSLSWSRDASIPFRRLELFLVSFSLYFQRLLLYSIYFVSKLISELNTSLKSKISAHLITVQDFNQAYWYIVLSYDDVLGMCYTISPMISSNKMENAYKLIQECIKHTVCQ